jgi:hypothetical protein
MLIKTTGRNQEVQFSSNQVSGIAGFGVATLAPMGAVLGAIALGVIVLLLVGLWFLRAAIFDTLSKENNVLGASWAGFSEEARKNESARRRAN